MDSLSHFLTNHLKEYIIHELEAGYSLESIKRILSVKGHSHDIINRATSSINFGSLRGSRNRKPMVKTELEEDFYYYIKNLLVQYMLEQFDKGYSIEEIKRVLRHHGHNEEIISEALTDINSGQIQPPSTDVKQDAPEVRINQKPGIQQHTVVKKSGKKSTKETGILIIAAVITFGTIFGVAVTADQSFMKVGLALFPVILTFIFGYFVTKKLTIKPLLFSVIILFSLLFYFMNEANMISILQGVDYAKFTTMNLFVGAIICFIYMKIDTDEPIRLNKKHEAGNKTAKGGNTFEMPKVPGNNELSPEQIKNQVEKG